VCAVRMCVAPLAAPPSPAGGSARYAAAASNPFGFPPVSAACDAPDRACAPAVTSRLGAASTQTRSTVTATNRGPAPALRQRAAVHQGDQSGPPETASRSQARFSVREQAFRALEIGNRRRRACWLRSVGPVERKPKLSPLLNPFLLTVDSRFDAAEARAPHHLAERSAGASSLSAPPATGEPQQGSGLADYRIWWSREKDSAASR
jgi:hypothetical protein